MKVESVTGYQRRAVSRTARSIPNCATGAQVNGPALHPLDAKVSADRNDKGETSIQFHHGSP
jgi:hypothetical protein